IMVASILGTSAVFASNSNAVTISDTITTVETSQNLVVQLIKEGENTLFPVRAVFEKLGFEVGYEPVGKIVTLTKGAQYVTFSTIEDGYTFARMAPQKLGQVPIVKEGITYVPVTLLTEIMQMEGVSVDGLTLTIEEKSEEAQVAEEAEVKIEQTIITAIDEKANTITVNEPLKGEIVLNIKDLKIEYTTEDKALMVGQAVEVEYGDISTASEPPINTPKSLKVVQKYDVVKVLNVEKDDKGNTKVLVKDEEMGEVVLIVSKETKMEGVEEIKIGQVLKVAMSNAMTMSIPPQTNAKEISIISAKTEEPEIEEAKEFSTVEIVSIDKENSQITIKDEKMGEVVLNISDEIKLEGISDINKVYELKAGDKLNVIYGEAMTRSLPPINNP
ncbi:MAG: copper amine oxidase N-terminal domain-containing protein, partial [Eubacteriales bacterium]|nr:copper amine oxidase N-terminal domain-containing protein [Eubacteriales bacterium]